MRFPYLLVWITCSSAADPSCVKPREQEHGEWFCSPHTYRFSCTLDCHPGYIQNNRSISTCVEGFWSTPPEEMKCVPALALVAGGFHNQRSVEIYSANGRCSRSLPNLPDNRVLHTLDNVDGHILLCGGDSNKKTTCLELNYGSLTWSHHSNLLVNRYFHSSIVKGGQLALLGGWSFRSTEVLNPSTSRSWSFGYDLREKTFTACTVKLTPESYLVIGGFYHPRHNLKYNGTSGASQRLQDLNQGRHRHGCAAVKSESTRSVIVTGGEGRRTQFLSSTEMYDLRTGIWKEVGHLQGNMREKVFPHRRDLKMVVLEDKVLVMGGKGWFFNPYTIVESFSLSSHTWNVTSLLLHKRSYHAVTTVPASNFDCTAD